MREEEQISYNKFTINLHSAHNVLTMYLTGCRKEDVEHYLVLEGGVVFLQLPDPLS